MQDDEGYDFSDPFDAKKFAMHHDRICMQRESRSELRWSKADGKLDILMKGGGIAVALALGLLGWSLKTNFDTQAAQVEAANKAVAAIHQTAQEASTETVVKLGATNAAATPQD